MATGLTAIQTVAKATGILPATISGAARSLREAGLDLWPQGAPGGGKKASHARPHHLVNLALALGSCTVTPITEAPAQVLRYRDLPRKPQGLGPLWGAVRPGTLGEYMVLLVQQLSIPGRFTLAELDHYRHPMNGLILTIRSNRAPAVSPFALLNVTHPGGGPVEFEYFGVDQHQPEPDGPAVALHVTARIPFELLELLGALWADTLAHEARTKNAAPGRAALPKDQDHNYSNDAPAPAIPSGDTSEAMRKRDLSQGASKYGPDPSRNRAMKDRPHERPHAAAGPGV